MCATHLLIMLYLSVKFHQICSSSLSDIAETRFLTDGLTDGRTDGRTDGSILICHRSSFGGIKSGRRNESMLPDRVSNPGPLTYESGALPIALRGPATTSRTS